MKFSNSDSRYVDVLGKRHDSGNRAANGNNSGDADLFLSKKGMGQHRGIPEEVIDQKSDLNNLIQKSSHLTHQLNNLLAIILANAQLALLILKDKELKSYLEALENATRDAGMIVHEFQESVLTLSGQYSQENVLNEIQQHNRK